MATHWGSKFGFIMATAGSAIGLGNIWRFPYLMAQYGGGAFLLAYLFSVIGIGIFVIMAKLAFGRVAQTDLPQAFDKVSARTGHSASKFWRFGAGYLGIFNSCAVICVYSIVIGWTLCYAVMGGVNLLADKPILLNQDTFHLFTSSFGYQLFWVACCVLICVAVMVRGVQKGIERLCSILMPLLFVLLIFLSVWLSCNIDIGTVLYTLLHPDWSRFGLMPNGVDYSILGQAVLAVLGQSLYSLSLGFGVMFVYGSYMNKTTDIAKSVKYIVLMDTLVAFLAGFIVTAALINSDIALKQGPELSFITLPLVFGEMQGGSVLMFIFFILLFLAALTSIISMYEAPINAMVKGEKISRTKAVCWVGLGNLFGSTLILLSFTGVLSLTIKGKSLFEIFDKITGEWTLSIMILVCCLFMGWRIFPQILNEVNSTRCRPLPKAYQLYWQAVLKVLAPLVMLILMLSVLI